MKINLDSINFTPEAIAKIEEKYSAKYVCETCILNGNGNWCNQPVTVFYQEKPPKGSNWFGLYWGGPECDTIFITDAKSAVESPWDGVIDSQTNDVYYSRYRHDFRQLPDEGFIDGGRDYMRTSVMEKERFVKLIIDKDTLKVAI